jgi:hypothetical protein
MSRTIAFASICPSCKRKQPTTFTVAGIVRLLNRGHPIEAYCVAGEEFWPIDCQKRVELTEAVAAASGGRFPLLGN